MDVGQLLREARVRAGISQRQLAGLAATMHSAVCAYEKGATSPTVRTFNRLLAACCMQVEAVLAPLAADDTDLRARALLEGATDPTWQVHNIAASLDSASVRWAYDRESALLLQGLAVPEHDPCIAAQDSDALRAWLRHVWMSGLDRQGFACRPTWEEADVRHYVRAPVACRFGYLRLRFVDALPEPVRVQHDGVTVPVLSLLAVELAHPDWARVLARVRQRSQTLPLAATRGSDARQ